MFSRHFGHICQNFFKNAMAFAQGKGSVCMCVHVNCGGDKSCVCENCGNVTHIYEPFNLLGAGALKYITFVRKEKLSLSKEFVSFSYPWLRLSYLAICISDRFCFHTHFKDLKNLFLKNNLECACYCPAYSGE